MQPQANHPQIAIGGRTISADHPCYVIAEVGVNHNGDVSLARQLIDAAAEAGADAVKFQTFRTDALVTRDAGKAAYQITQTGAGSQAEMLSALELSGDQFRILQEHCSVAGVDIISTAFDDQSLDLIIELGPKCLKWPSGEITNLPMLRKAARSGLPIILSTGMARLSEVAAAVDAISEEKNPSVAILHCVSNYPAPLEEQNLRAIATMAQAFGRPTGYSDHTDGLWAAIAARPLGMAILEKHITLDRTMSGPDHAASIEPDMFAEMVRALRRIEVALGDGVKRPMPSELATREAARKSLVYARGLEAGHMLHAADLAAKRPGTGIGPERLDFVVGSRLTRAVTANQHVAFDDFH